MWYGLVPGFRYVSQRRSSLAREKGPCKYAIACAFRCLQERDALQGNILTLADQQFPQQTAGDVLSILLEPTKAEVPDNAEHRGFGPESEWHARKDSEN